MSDRKKLFYLAKKNESDAETLWQLIEYVPAFLFLLFSLIVLLSMRNDLFLTADGYSSQINAYNYGATAMPAVDAWETWAKGQFATGALSWAEMQTVLEPFLPIKNFDTTLNFLQVVTWISLVFALGMVLPFALPATKNKVVVFGGKTGLPLGMVLSLGSVVFYLIDLILGCVLLAQIPDAAPILVGSVVRYTPNTTLPVVLLVFSLLFFLFDAACVVLQTVWEEKKSTLR